MDADWLLSRLVFLVPVWLSLSVHEWAHAFTAFRLGDDTAARMGRMTLNPIAHIDPVGTLLLPLLGVPFGWAKPVPINPNRFDRQVSLRTGIVLTAGAGPLSNVVLALVSALGLVGVARLAPGHGTARYLLEILLIVNVALAVFNAVPIPPLDGSRVVDGLLPDRLRPGWDAFCGVAPLALGALILAPWLFGVSILSAPIAWAQALVRGLAGG